MKTLIPILCIIAAATTLPVGFSTTANGSYAVGGFILLQGILIAALTAHSFVTTTASHLAAELDAADEEYEHLYTELERIHHLITDEAHLARRIGDTTTATQSEFYATEIEKILKEATC